MTRIYKFLDRPAWKAAQAAGTFYGSPVDLADGFIHFSTASQAPETARLHFRWQGDLVLLAMEAEDLGEALRWEPSRGGELFPHLYASLATASVVAVRPLELDADGIPQPGVLAP